MMQTLTVHLGQAGQSVPHGVEALIVDFDGAHTQLERIGAHRDRLCRLDDGRELRAQRVFEGHLRRADRGADIGAAWVRAGRVSPTGSKEPPMIAVMEPVGGC